MEGRNYDASLWSLIEKEKKRQQNNLELIASENIVSKEVMEAQGTILTNKYAEGYPHSRYYGGCEIIDNIEEIAIKRAKKIFGAKFANVQPHSGSQANLAAYLSLVEFGDTILSMDLSSGGHLTHGSMVNISGQIYNFVHYVVNPTTELIDYDMVLDLAHKHRPKLIVAGASSYSRSINFSKFKNIARDVGAKLLVDMAHIAGLVAARFHQSPIPYADVITSTTHKTLRGPRGGIILTNCEELIKKINKSLFPGIQGGPLEHVIAAKAVAFNEVLDPNFRTYIQQVILNSQSMAQIFNRSDKARLVSGGTDNHLLLIDIRKFGMTGKEAEFLLDSVNITVNKNAIPFESLDSLNTSGIRLGTPAITSRGFNEKDSAEVANLIIKVLENKNNKKVLEEVKFHVKLLTSKYPLF